MIQFQFSTFKMKKKVYCFGDIDTMLYRLMYNAKYKNIVRKYFFIYWIKAYEWMCGLFEIQNKKKK